MRVLRDATNQQELKFAQRHLATMQRYADKYEFPSHNLADTPQFLVKEAQLQAAWVEERKKERDIPKQKTVPNSCLPHDECAACDFQVECRVCNCFYSWSELAAGDGCCVKCQGAVASRSRPATLGIKNDPTQDSAEYLPGDNAFGLLEEIFVDCAGCGVSASWSLLSLGDGRCPACVGGKHGADLDQVVETGYQNAASSSARWQRHRSQAGET